MSFVLAHVSDLHVSEFGDTFHDRLRIVKRSANVVAVDPKRYETVWEEAGWRVVHERGKRRAKIALVDPESYAHPIPSVKEGKGLLDPIERAAAKACRLEARKAAVLAEHLPSPGALRVLFEGTPRNSNLRLLRAAAAIEEAGADAVCITGDLTDDGVGYELIEAAFARWKDKGMLFAIPGNHDLYLFPMRGSGRPKPTHATKRAAWNAFAARLGLELHATGAWVRHLPQANTVLVGLDSCARPQRRFYRHNGGLGQAQLEYLRELGRSPEWKGARHRIALLHHHVVPLPHGVGRRAPSEIGMRLDDARSAAEVFDEVGITAVMHGHRHVSEQRQPAGSNFKILASPSLTLGCRSGDEPSFWRVELDGRMHAERVRVPVEAMDQDEDPTELGALMEGALEITREITIDVEDDEEDDDE
ncbi:MAG: metallophosphoesterase [Labilithrix sp.]|nr:metallophosphoesterase [Labilithrix sp.]MCW5817417.1 metallophosphoesterase [Labilithrix sp.]